MQQLELDFESREQKLLRYAFKIGFARGTKYPDAHLSTDNVAERMADEFMRQMSTETDVKPLSDDSVLQPLMENSNDENE